MFFNPLKSLRQKFLYLPEAHLCPDLANEGSMPFEKGIVPLAEGSSRLRIDVRSDNMELIAKYHVETDLPIKKAAEAIAAEQSTGTWTEVHGQDNPLAARVISAEGKDVESAFPRSSLSRGMLLSTYLWWREISLVSAT
jgi:hypothetical protein